MQKTVVPKFTYIIPFRYSLDRIVPLRRVVEWINGFQGIEVIIVEQDKHSKINYMNLKAIHIFTESDYLFNKSWAYNVGLKWARSPIVIFGEADTIMNPHDLIKSLESLEKCDCVLPIKNVIKLSNRESLIDLKDIFNLPSQGIPNTLTGGISLFKKESIQKIGGWNEDFIGVSLENQFQDHMVKNFLNWKQMDFNGYHLYHNITEIDHNLLQRNRDIYSKFESANKSQLQSHINFIIPKIGNLNKYQQ